MRLMRANQIINWQAGLVFEKFFRMYNYSERYIGIYLTFEAVSITDFEYSLLIPDLS